MPMKFDRSMCVNLQETISREWLITNGVGGYAAGTIAGMQTRREHGLLVASARECSSPQLLLSKIDEEIVFDQRTYYLGTNEYRDGALNPAGYVHLESFRLEEGFPVFTYHLGGIDGIVLEKRIWMPQGLNTTYIHYRVVRTTSPEHADYHCARSTTSDYAARFHADVHAAQRNLSLTLLPLTAHRPASALQRGSEEQFFEVETQHIDLENSRPEQRQSIAGFTIHAGEGARPYHIFAVGHAESQTTFLPTGVWYWNFLHRADKAKGREAADDLYLPGVFRTTLWPGDDAELTIIITAEDLSWQMFTTPQLKRAYADAIEYQRGLSRAQRYFGDGGVAVHAQPVLPVAHNAPHEASRREAPEELTAEEFLHTLFQASNRFLCARTLPLREQEGNLASILGKTQTIPTIVSGFYEMEESTRDTLIALPGLTLATGRYAEARRILSNLSRTFSRGLLPDHLPTEAFPTNSGNESSVDTTLWFFYALDAYLRATTDYDLLDDLFERLEESIAWLVRGTAGGIGVDARDGLLQASLPGKALTWMNAFDGDTPVTPRAGKPVEANALWYNALSLMQEWSGYLRRSASINHSLRDYEDLRQQCKQSFNQRFWYNKSYLYDVIDGPRGDDISLRPNQLFALALRYPVLDTRYWPGVMEAIRKHLLTPFGVRSLAPQSAGYIGRIGGGINEQGQLQRGLHSGGAWPWLFGAYIDALFAMQEAGIDMDADKGNSNAGTQRDTAWRAGVELLTTFRTHLSSAMLGYVASVYDGDDPQLPHGQLASANSTGELLRIYKLLAHTGIRLPDRELPVA